VADIYQTLWDQDENRCSVAMPDGEGGWTDPNADILLDEQARASGRRAIDAATRPLFARVKEEKLGLPTYAAFIELLDNYVAHFRLAEDVTPEESDEVTHFLDLVVATNVAHVAHGYLNRELGENLSLEQFRRILHRLWFEMYTNHFGTESVHFASGFEHVFVGEAKYDKRFSGLENLGEISGYHSWIKFYLDEKYQRANFLGYKYDLQGTTGADNPDVVTLQMLWNLTDVHGNVLAQLFKKKGGFFVGPSPECELVMGAVAFYESLHGRLRNERRRTEIGTGVYDLVLYRNTTREGSRGELIRSFYPEFLGPVGDALAEEEPDVDRPVIEPVPDPAEAAVVIAAALPNPSGSDEGKEWIEVLNQSTEPVELADWELRDRSGRPQALTGTLAAGERRRVVVTRTHPNGLQLGNKGGQITLHKGARLVHAVGYARAPEGEVLRFVNP
jgi:poly(U)-specific endoribonuclease